jgi:chaperonin GroEL (HSP60 family)
VIATSLEEATALATELIWRNIKDVTMPTAASVRIIAIGSAEEKSKLKLVAKLVVGAVDDVNTMKRGCRNRAAMLIKTESM